MKTVLCFGDSYTYGQVPGTMGANIESYDVNNRWTSLLQKKLGEGWHVIDEGLPSRTIDKEDPRPGKEGRNGINYIRPCIESHLPLDYIIIWLGTNDLKKLYKSTANQIAVSMKNFLGVVGDTLKGRNTRAKIILVAPPPFDDTNEIIKDLYEGTANKLKQVADEYNNLASDLGYSFVNLYDQLEVPESADGIHLTPDQNQQVANVFYKELSS